MKKYFSFLITICIYNSFLIKIALKINKEDIDPNVFCCPNEIEHKKILHSFLPEHIKIKGPIVHVENINDIIYIKSNNNITYQ